jgi:hypothetical protein
LISEGQEDVARNNANEGNIDRFCAREPEHLAPLTGRVEINYGGPLGGNAILPQRADVCARALDTKGCGTKFSQDDCSR